MSLLEVANLGGGYQKAPILRDLNLQVERGEMVACFGANGAGKTTLLRAVSGSLPICTGSVLLDSVDIARSSPWARVRAGIAHVPEGRHVFKGMSVRENLEVGGLTGGREVALSDVYELFPVLGERQDQVAGTLSGGQQQMLVVGRALMSAPKIILIDEMSAGLAPVMVDRLLDGLVGMLKRGVSLLLVEQAPHFLAGVVDRAYLLERGSIVRQGTMDELGGPAGIAELYLGVS